MKQVFTNRLEIVDDSWDRSNQALLVLRRSLDALLVIKPDEKKEPEQYRVWFKEYRELQTMFSQQHYRRINLVIESKKTKEKIT